MKKWEAAPNIRCGLSFIQGKTRTTVLKKCIGPTTNSYYIIIHPPKTLYLPVYH